jgi:peptidyl-prolyl cis-trans isomerase C
MKNKSFLTVVFASLFLAAPIYSSAQNAVIVNGKSISKAKLDRLVEKSGQPSSPEVREKGRELLITREILLQEADKRGISQREDIKDQIEISKMSVIVAAVFEDYIAKEGVPDSELQAVYDSVKGQFGGKEYKVRHILIEKESDAKALTAKLKAGGSFEELAKVNSKDTGSAVKGGDLDWVTPAALVPEFSKAMTALEKGQMTSTPVKSQFGWHIIRLEDARETKVPSLQELKPQLMQMLSQDEKWQRAKFGEMMQKFRTKAKIQ